MSDSVYNLNDFHVEAKLILESAKNQAEEILNATRADIQQKKLEAEKKGYQEGHQKGYKEGFEQGFKEGQKAATAEVEKKTAYLKDNLVRILTELEMNKADILQKAEADLIRLSIEISKKITHAKFSNEPELIHETVMQAIKFTSQKNDINIFIHPEDRIIIETFIPQLRSRFDELDKISLTDNPKIARGGCVVSSKAGLVDQTIDSQFQKITQQLLSVQKTTEQG